MQRLFRPLKGPRAGKRLGPFPQARMGSCSATVRAELGQPGATSAILETATTPVIECPADRPENLERSPGISPGTETLRSRRQGISPATCYTSLRRFRELQLFDVKRLRVPEGKNAKLKRLLADRMFGYATAAEVPANMVISIALCKAVGFIQGHSGLSVRWNCRPIGMARSVRQYRLVARQWSGPERSESAMSCRAVLALK